MLFGRSDGGDSFRRLGPYLERSMAFTCAAPPAFLESDAVHDSSRLVSHINPRDRDCSLGTGLLVAEMSA